MSSNDLNRLMLAAPSRAAAQAALELGISPTHQPAALPHDLKKYKSKGALTAEHIAAALEDPDELRKFAQKERRVGALTQVLLNPHCTAECVLDVCLQALHGKSEALVTQSFRRLSGDVLTQALQEFRALPRPRQIGWEHIITFELRQRLLAGEEDIAVRCVQDHPEVLESLTDYTNLSRHTSVDPEVVQRLVGKVPGEAVIQTLVGVLRARTQDVPPEVFAAAANVTLSDPKFSIKVGPAEIDYCTENLATAFASPHEAIRRAVQRSGRMDEDVFASNIDWFLENLGDCAWTSWDWTPKMLQALFHGMKTTRHLALFSDVAGVLSQSYFRDAFCDAPAKLWDSLRFMTNLHGDLFHQWGNGKLGALPTVEQMLSFRNTPWFAKLVRGYSMYAKRNSSNPDVIPVLAALYPVYNALPDTPVLETVTGGYLAYRLGDDVAAWKLFYALAEELPHGADYSDTCDTALALAEAA